MIEFIHKYPILIKILLTLTTIAFVGTGGYYLQDTVQYAAKVGDRNITMQEYQNGVNNMESFYRRVYQGNLPEELLKNLNIQKMALDQLIDRQVMLIVADRLDLGASDDEVAETIRTNASFHDETGNFSKKVYTQVLKLNNITPKAFEQSVRDDMTVDKLRKVINDSVVVTDDDIRRYFREQREAQGLPFDETAYAEQKDSLGMTVQNVNRDKALRAVVDGLKSELKIEVTPGVLPAG